MSSNGYMGEGETDTLLVVLVVSLDFAVRARRKNCCRMWGWRARANWIWVVDHLGVCVGGAV